MSVIGAAIFGEIASMQQLEALTDALTVECLVVSESSGRLLSAVLSPPTNAEPGEGERKTPVATTWKRTKRGEQTDKRTTFNACLDKHARTHGIKM